MFQHQDIWLPDGEKHFPQWMDRNGELVNGRGTYQIKKIREALKHCFCFRVAVDVGAHVGLWSMHMSKMFNLVHAFEPMAQFRACFGHNVQDKNVLLYPVALGATPGRATMAYEPSDSGGTHVKAAGNGGDVEMRTLDEFAFSDVDFIKVDCEGYEHHVLDGARELLMRCRPVIIVEQKPHKLEHNFGVKGTPAVALLSSMGYAVAKEIGGDYIMVPHA